MLQSYNGPTKSEYLRVNQKSSCVLSRFSHVRFFVTPWNSPGQNTGVGSLSLLQGIFPTQDQTQVSHIAGGFFTS